jgi:hypothetical protein
MHRLYIVIAALALAATVQPVGRASAQYPTVDLSQPPVPVSQVIRQAGYSLSDAEAAYLDAEEQMQAQYAAPLFQVLTLAGPATGLPDAATQASIVAELQQLLALDPNAAPQAPPALQRIRELAFQHRAALQRAAALWLAALQAGDADWRLRGAEEFAAAQESLAGWIQEMVSRYPPPSQPPQP